MMSAYPYDWIAPSWPSPANVKSLVTTRSGGYSESRYDSMNLGFHVNDNPEHVQKNAAFLQQYLPGEPLWLRQVHGVAVVDADSSPPHPEADAVIARQRKKVCAILTADCLPVLLCNQAGTVVGAAHAGWRGLCAGVIEEAVAAMKVVPREIQAYLGPAIGPMAFEVGEEVRAAFLAHDRAAQSCFIPADPGKWLADLYQLARLRLAAAGVQKVYGGGYCTYKDSSRFYSYRRDGVTGRMASLIWIE